MIPKIFHAVWLGDRPAPMALLNTWRAFHPDFELRLWTSATCTPCSGAPASRHFTSWGGRGFLPGIWEKLRPPGKESYILGQVPGPWKNDAQLRALDAQPLGAHLAYSAQSDILRFEILAEYGGIYVDMDTECLARLPDRFLQSESFGGWESETALPGWVASCVLGARPGSRLFREIVAAIPELDMTQNPAHELGPGIVTRHAKTSPEFDVQPSAAFTPHYYQGTVAPTGETWSRHHWGGTKGLRRDADGRWLDHVPVVPAHQYRGPDSRRPRQVAIVIPCFRQARFLPEAVASVRAQTHTDWDLTVAVGDEESKRVAMDLDVGWIEDGGKGLSNARNVAIGVTFGRYILPLDADDVLDPTFLERTLPHVENGRFAIACTRVREFGGRTGQWNLRPFDGVLEDNALPSCALFTRELWRAVGGYDVSVIGYEDWDFWIRCSELNPRVTQLEEYLFGYRVHDQSWMHWDAVNHADAYWRAMIRLRHPSLYDAARIDEDRELMGHMPAPLLDRLRRRARAFPLNHACQAFVDLVVRSDSRAARAAAAAKEMAQGAKTWNEHVRLSPACGAHELEAGRIGAVSVGVSNCGCGWGLPV